jgi:putative membrane protein
MNDALKITLGVIAGVLVLLLALVLFGGAGMFGMGPMMQGFGNGPGGMMGGGGFGFWWMLGPILIWGGLLVLVAWAIARIFPAGRRDGGEERRDSAEEILRERLARGEIDREKYERTLETLRGRTARETTSH